jgi:hypothetical protein
MKITAVRDIAPYSHVEVDRHYRNIYRLCHQGSENGLVAVVPQDGSELSVCIKEQAPLDQIKDCQIHKRVFAPRSA